MRDTSNLLFSPFGLGPVELKNRLVALPVFTGYAYADGRVSDMLLDHYARLAGSGVAMVVVANVAVSADGRTSTHCLRIDRDDYIQGLAGLARTIQKHGALACLQLNHAGQYARTEQPRLAAPAQARYLRFKVSALREFMEFFPFEQRYGLTRRFFRQANTWRTAMTAVEREDVVAGFSRAAQRAYSAGFDMLEIHGANGYLICQFLSAFTNGTPSVVGGNLDNRCIFPLSLVRAVKTNLPAGFPVGFRLMLQEWVPDGITPAEATLFARKLQVEDIAYLSVSAGTFTSIFRHKIRQTMSRAGYLSAETAQLTRQVRVPTILSGRIQTPEQAVRAIAVKSADLIGLGRALRTDPEWVAKARRPDRKIQTCVNCMGCLKRVIMDQGFICLLWPKWLQLKTDLAHQLLDRTYKALCVMINSHDIDKIMALLGLLWHPGNRLAGPQAPTFFWAEPAMQTTAFEMQQQRLHDWIAERTAGRFSPGQAVNTITVKEPASYSETIRRIIRQGGYGMVVMAREPALEWQTRLLFQERRRVFALADPNPHQARMVMPVDLSEVTLLILTFLKQIMAPDAGIQVHALHISGRPGKEIQQQWRRMKKVCGIEAPQWPLHVIDTKHGIAPTILDFAHTNDCGTIVMGKRGLSGIKRLVLGSVSARVLKELSGQSLILID